MLAVKGVCLYVLSNSLDPIYSRLHIQYTLYHISIISLADTIMHMYVQEVHTQVQSQP